MPDNEHQDAAVSVVIVRDRDRIAYIETLERTNATLRREVDLLKEQVDLLQHRYRLWAILRNHVQAERPMPQSQSLIDGR